MSRHEVRGSLRQSLSNQMQYSFALAFTELEARPPHHCATASNLALHELDELNEFRNNIKPQEG